MTLRTRQVTARPAGCYRVTCRGCGLRLEISGRLNVLSYACPTCGKQFTAERIDGDYCDEILLIVWGGESETVKREER